MWILALIIAYISGYLCSCQKGYLEQQLANSKRRVLEKEGEVKETDARLQALTIEKDELQRQFLTVTLENTRRLSSMTSDLQRKELELKESVQLNLTLKKENGGLEEQLHAVTRRNEGLAKRVVDLESAEGKVEGELGTLRSRRAATKEPAFQHSRLLAKRDKEIRDLKASLRMAEQAREKQRNKVNGKQWEGEVSRLKANLSAAEAKCSLKDSQIQGMSRELQKLRASSKEWEWEASRLKTTLITTEAKSGSSEERVHVLTQEMQILRTTNERLGEENAQLKDRVGEYIRLHNSGGCPGFHHASQVIPEVPGAPIGCDSNSNSPAYGPFHSAPNTRLPVQGVW